jgi:hypothetical protein
MVAFPLHWKVMLEINSRSRLVVRLTQVNYAIGLSFRHHGSRKNERRNQKQLAHVIAPYVSGFARF